jgi:hypothetical protein
MRTLLPILIAAASTAAALSAPPTWEATPVVVLTLRPAVAVPGPQVAVRDVASLEGGSLALRQRVGALDLIDTPAGAGEAVVSRGQIVYRLLLAGLDEPQFRVVGPASVRIGRGSTPAITPVGGVSAAPAPAVEPRPAAAPPLLHEGLVGGKDGPVLVKCRDVVRLVTRVGDLDVVATGEAMEDGRAGQDIRLRNVDSGRMVRGRVADRSTVEVDFVRSKP